MDGGLGKLTIPADLALSCEVAVGIGDGVSVHCCDPNAMGVVPKADHVSCLELVQVIELRPVSGVGAIVIIGQLFDKSYALPGP